MAVTNIDKLHLSLKELFKISPVYAGTFVSFQTMFGEVLTIELDSTIVVQYAQNKIPAVTFPQSIFWKYGNDAFVDATMSLPDYVWYDVIEEVKRLGGDTSIDVEVIE